MATASEILGGNLRRLRHERGLTLEALAHEAGLHWTYISTIERRGRNVSIRNIARLARALRVPIAQLVEGCDDYDEAPPGDAAGGS